MAVTEVTRNNFENEIVKSDRPVLIDLWADWCGPCKMMSPLVDEISEKITDVKFCKINVDDEPALAQFFDASSIPMFVIVKDGVIADAVVGARPAADLEEFINKNK